MRHLKLEKSIKKIDRELEALQISKKYLVNSIDEIDEVREILNSERQVLADGLYLEDGKSYLDVSELIKDLLNKELGKEEQKELLQNIKEIYGRQSPNPSKENVGLNAWLKHINANYEWKEQEDSEWANLTILSLE